MGRVLGELGRLALRTGKRARTETGIDQAGLSLLTVAVELAAASLGSGPGADALAGRDVLIVGAGSMSALAAATAARSGAASIVVANRTRSHAERLAADVSATAAGLADLPAAMAAADIVISCTGAAGHGHHRRDGIGRDYGPGAGRRQARSSSSISRCRATWSPPWPACPASC